MANRKHQLIHLHGTTQLDAVKAEAAGMVAGEIAVMNAAEAGKSEIYVLTADGKGVETFITKAAIEGLDAAVLSAAKSDAATKASAAQEAAQDYADGIKENLQGQIDAIVGDGEGSIADQIAEVKSELTQDIATAKSAAEATAKGYADDAQAAAIASGKTYADGIVGDLETSLNSAISAETTARQTAISGLTDTVEAMDAAYKAADTNLQKAITAEETARKEAISAVTTTVTNLETTLKTYADGKASAAETAAKGYTDEREGIIKKYADDAVAGEKALREAADTQIRTDFAAADTALETTLKAYAEDEADAAEAAAKGYADNKAKEVNDALTAHTGNGDIHISASERTLWTKAANEFNTFMTSEEIDETVNTLHEIQNWMNGEGVDATELTDAIAVETKNRQDADAALSDRIAKFETGDNSVAKQLETLKDELEGYADDAKDDAIASANAYTDGEITKVSNTVSANKTDIEGKLAAAKTELQGYADQAELDAIASAKTYTDNRETAITAAYEAYADKAEEDAIAAAGQALAGAKSELQAAIDAKVAQADYDAKMLLLDAKDAELNTAITNEATARDTEDKRLAGLISDMDTAYKAADTKIRTDFAAADTQIRTDFAAADTALGNRIKAIEDTTIVTNVAVTGAEGVSVNTLANGANGVATIDFSNMVIDCGEY